MKKTLLLSILCLSSVAMTAWSQNLMLGQEEPENKIEVVGYFCKNDTMTYRQRHSKCIVQENDTTLSETVSESYVEEFMIVVTDSTGEGYKMMYIPQSFTFDTTALDTGTPTSQMTINAIAMRQLMQSVVCEFTTDEKGLLKSIINWREISDQLKKGVKATCDNLYATITDLDTTMLRQQLGVILALHFTTEKGIRNSYMELEDLFGLYGSTYEIGRKEVETEEQGYPQIISSRVCYTTIEDEGNDFDYGDYSIARQLTTSIPFDDVMNIGFGSLAITVSEMVNGSFEANPNDAEVLVSDFYGFMFFKNGWPKKYYFEEAIGLGSCESIETRYIECTSRK